MDSEKRVRLSVDDVYSLMKIGGKLGRAGKEL